MDKINEIFNWWEYYNYNEILIKTKNYEFNIDINDKQLPHLLGLHYIEKGKIRPREIINIVRKNSDEKIMNMIKKNNPNQYEFVENRIKYFKFFMENLDKAILYNQTNEESKIKSEFLLVKLDENKYLQLGIGRDKNYEDYFETFLINKDEFYFKDSKIKEPVLSIYKYDNLDLVPFSFNYDKNIRLSEINHSLTDDEMNELLLNINFDKLEEINYNNFSLYPLKNLDKDFIEKSTLQEISKYLEVDSLNSDYLIRKDLIDKYNKDENIEFYKSVPKEYKETDLFFCKETRGIYIPTVNGLMKYSKFDNELLNILKDNFNLQISEKIIKEYNEKYNNTNLNLKLLIIDFVNKTYDKEIELKDFELLCKDISRIKLIDEVYNKHSVVYELDLKKYQSNIFIDNNRVLTKNFLGNNNLNEQNFDLDFDKLKENIESDLKSLDIDFIKNSITNRNIFIDNIRIDEYLEFKEEEKDVLDKDMDNDGVIDRYDADFRDSKVQEIGQLYERDKFR